MLTPIFLNWTLKLHNKIEKLQATDTSSRKFVKTNIRGSIAPYGCIANIGDCTEKLSLNASGETEQYARSRMFTCSLPKLLLRYNQDASL